MKNLGPRLFHRHNLYERFETMGPEIRDVARSAVEDDPSVPAAELRGNLRAMFGLQPLELGPLQTLRVSVWPWRDKVGNAHHKYVAEARLPFWGLPLLFQINPEQGFKFPYRGMVASASVGFRKFVLTKDLGPFEVEVQEVLAETRLALAADASRVLDLNRVIEEVIENMMVSLGVVDI